MTVVDPGPSYGLVLQVGGVAGIDTVNFAVTGPNTGLTPAPVASADIVEVSVEPLRDVFAEGVEIARHVSLRVDSSAGLACQTHDTCGGVSIPFGKIGWTASNNSLTGGDIQSGTFDDSVDQLIALFDANATTALAEGHDYRTRQMHATRMTFVYANDERYPAGTYFGTVRFTASMP